MVRLRNKIALLTGGTSGIGLATAKLFVEKGARVFVTGRNDAALAEAQRAVPEVSALRADASNLSDIDALFEEMESKAGISGVRGLKLFARFKIRIDGGFSLN